MLHIGMVYGRLTLIDRAPPKGNTKAYPWVCKCECGNVINVTSSNLNHKTSPTRSCGCLRKELVIASNTTHGLSKTPEYKAWCDMKRRCTDEGGVDFVNYGGRGITVCEAWNTFESFIKDVGLRPSELHTLGRTDNDGNYEPSNVKWETRKEQNRNKRNTSLATIDGATATLMEWSEIAGINYSTVKSRVKNGMTPEGAILQGPPK